MQKISVVKRDGASVGILEEASSAALTVRLEDGQRALVSRADLEPLADGTVLLRTPVEQLSLLEQEASASVVSAATVPIDGSPSRSSMGPAPDGSELITIPRVEEQLEVEKITRESARVHVHVKATEREQAVSVALTDQHAEISRVQIGRMVDAPPPVREDGDTVIIPVLEEVLVIQKRLLLREEIHVVRRPETRTEEHVVSLRSEHVDVTRSEKS
ncbi:MAG: uncharacterized protein JWN04_1936 [Myxococcaceae bacterium]|nr:uncharacterized protein [Myxococcaceae bacterium]